jgi:RNA polymerase sigma-70 factor (ECF subfamily)
VKDTDAELVRRAVAGSSRSFDRLVDRHYARCLRFARNQLGGATDAEDAVQEAFVRAWRSLSACTPELFGSWLTAIVVNCCRAAGAKRRRRRDATSLDAVDARRLATPPPRVDEPLDRTAVGRALATLTPRLREAFQLRHDEELSYAEKMEITGVGESALQMRVSRAVEVMAAALERVDGE